MHTLERTIQSQTKGKAKQRLQRRGSSLQDEIEIKVVAYFYSLT
jgi:hypothetical protein